MMNPLICCVVGGSGEAGMGPGGVSGNVGGGGGGGGPDFAGDFSGSRGDAGSVPPGANPVASGDPASQGFGGTLAGGGLGLGEGDMSYGDFDFSTFLESKLEEYTMPPMLSKALAPFPLIGQAGKIAAVLDSITVALGGTPGGGSGEIGEQGGPGEQNQQLLTNILQSIPDTKPESSLVSRLGLPSINKLDYNKFNTTNLPRGYGTV